MKARPFEIKDVLSVGWHKTKEHIWFLVGLQLVVYLVNYVAGHSLIGVLIGMLSSLLLARMALRIIRGERVGFDVLFQGLTLETFAHYFVAAVIVSLLTIAGLILFIVPGIYIAIVTVFAVYVIAEPTFKPRWKELSFWKAIKESRRIAKGAEWQLLWFFFLALLINLLGVIALGVGLLVSIPVTAIALAKIYDIRKQAMSNVEVVPTSTVGH